MRSGCKNVNYDRSKICASKVEHVEVIIHSWKEGASRRKEKDGVTRGAMPPCRLGVRQPTSVYQWLSGLLY